MYLNSNQVSIMSNMCRSINVSNETIKKNKNTTV